MFEKINLHNATPILVVIFFVIAIFLRGQGDNTSNNNLMSVANFLFGIFVAFAVANGHSKITRINQVLKDHEGEILFIYKASSSWGDEVKKKIQKLSDSYLIDQLDYFLSDFKYSSKTYFELFDYVLELPTKTEVQKSLYGNMVNALHDGLKQRKNVEALVSDRMSFFEWFSILTLLCINIFFSFYMNDGSWVTMMAAVLISISAIVITFVLRDLDILRWKEDTWIWEPLENLFKEMDLLPYYPEDVVKSKRASVEKGSSIRIAKYPNKYPDMSDKKIEEIVV